MTKVEVVRWLDSGMAVSDGWQGVEYYKERASTDAMEVVSVGLPMHEDDEVLLLAGSWDPVLDQFLNVQVIVKGNILARHEVAALDDGDGTYIPLAMPFNQPFSVYQGACGHLWKSTEHQTCPVCPLLSYETNEAEAA